jgi:hypothetical protein
MLRFEERWNAFETPLYRNNYKFNGDLHSSKRAAMGHRDAASPILVCPAWCVSPRPPGSDPPDRACSIMPSNRPAGYTQRGNKFESVIR